MTQETIKQALVGLQCHMESRQKMLDETKGYQPGIAQFISDSIEDDRRAMEELRKELKP